MPMIRHLFDTMPLGVVYQAADDQVITANPAAERILGLSVDQMRGRTGSDPQWSTIREDGSPFPAEEYPTAVALRTGKPVEHVVMGIMNPEKSAHTWISVSAVPLFREGESRPHEAYAIFEEITGRQKTEETLRRCEASYRFLAEGMQDIAWTTDLQLETTYVSPSVERVLGFGAGEWMRRPLADKLAPESLRRATERLAEELAEDAERAPDRSITLEFDYYHKNGTTRCLETTLSFSRDAEGTPVGVYGLSRDITDRHRAEEALRESEERFRTVMESLPAGLFAHDLDGRIVLCNEAACRNTGYSRRELLGMEVADIDPASVTRDDRMRLWHALSRGESTVIESTHVRKDGSEYPAEIQVNAVTLDGRPIILALAYDITERRQADATLRKNEERYRLLAENTLDTIWQMDMDFRFTYVNSAVKAHLGYEPEEWVGTHLAEHCSPEEVARMGTILQESLQHLDPSNGVVFETVIYHKDGREIPVEIHGNILVDSHGRPLAVQGTTRDITDRKRAEKDRERLEGQLRQAQKMEAVGQLAGGVAHDFNNMLGVILGHTELAMDRMDPGDPLLADLQEVHNAAQRSADLTRQLLAFARKQTIAPRVLDLNETVEGMLKMLLRLIGEDIDLAWRPGSEVWPVKVDPSQIDHILANLCVNSRDAIAGQGKVTIETRNEVFDKAYCADHPGAVEGDYALLAVSDDGCGMDRETMGRLFEPYFTTKGAGKGTGLGLATVYGIVKQNDGFINVYSEPGEGTTFKIYLPRHREDGIQAEHDAVPPPATAGGPELILLVEDEPSILKLAKRMLERLGYEVLAAGTSREALRLAEEHRGSIRLLLTDVIMPEMNGRELARSLLSLNPGLKCLFTSGYTADVIARHGVLDEGVHFLQKPFSMEDLATKVRMALEEA